MTKWVTKCDRDYKLRQGLRSATGITKCDRDYKVRQGLQSATGITKCDRDYKVIQVQLLRNEELLETMRKPH